jgi:sugar phosphate isomerase/epimerase
VKVISQAKPSRLSIAVALAAALSMLLALVAASAADAERRGAPAPKSADCDRGRTVPVSKISIQLYTFNRYVERGERANEAPEGAPGPEATRAERLEFVLAFLSEAGYRNIEPYSFHGLNVHQFDALADKYRLRVPSRHMSTSEANWDANIADARVLGQRWTGSGGFASPGMNTYENVLATAQTMNRLGKRSVQNGTGRIFGHNHAGEFEREFVDSQGDGTRKSAWQILVENTDPRYVDMQLDVGWAVVGDTDPVPVMEEFGDRIKLFHVKDIIDVGKPTERQTTVGQGEIDWAALFAVSHGRVKQYVIEQDPPVEPFSFAAESFEYVDCLQY